MRKFIYFFLIFYNISFCQSIDFVDKKLEKHLLNNFNGVLKSGETSSSLDSNKNGKIEIYEALNVKEIQLDIDKENFQSLEDFKYFKNIIAIRIYREIWYQPEFGNTLHLDLTNFVDLKSLDISSNSIKSISVKNCLNIELISIKNYGSINVELIGLIDCKKIIQFETIGIVMDNIDLSDCKGLVALYLMQDIEKEKVNCNLILPNENKIIAIGLENINLMNTLKLENLFYLKLLIIKNTNLKTLNVKNLTKLELIECVNNEIVEAKFEDNDVLKYVYICNNPIINIEVKGNMSSLIGFFVTPSYYDKFKQDYGKFSFFEKVKPLESSMCKTD